MNVKDIVSLWMGKAVAFGCRATRLGGSSLPGLLVTRVNPRFIGKAAGGHPHGDLVVTGTNGKTTTTRMIFGILREAGYRPVYNESGANLLSGIATTLVEDLSLSGRSKSDIGLFEVDEATTPRVCGDLKVAGLVITNISADQVDRFGELDHTLALIRQGLREMSKEAFLAVNADDPLVASLGQEVGADQEVIYFGRQDQTPPDARDGTEGRILQEAKTTDARQCPKCGATYVYKAVYCGHLGVYECEACGVKRPDPNVSLVQYHGYTGGTGTVITGYVITVKTPLGQLVTRIPVSGAYNIYNALAAISAGIGLGIDLPAIKKGLEGFSASFGRMETILVGNKRVVFALVKNSAGCNQVIQTILQSEGKKSLILCVNDNPSDGIDVSWLWDVDFESLAREHDQIEFIIGSGTRASDVSLRLKYAALPESLVTSLENPHEALREGLKRTNLHSTLYVLPTYTAMLKMRASLKRLDPSKSV